MSSDYLLEFEICCICIWFNMPFQQTFWKKYTYYSVRTLLLNVDKLATLRLFLWTGVTGSLCDGQNILGSISNIIVVVVKATTDWTVLLSSGPLDVVGYHCSKHWRMVGVVGPALPSKTSIEYQANSNLSKLQDPVITVTLGCWLESYFYCVLSLNIVRGWLREGEGDGVLTKFTTPTH